MRARDNPFRTEQLERLSYRLQTTTWPKLWMRLETLRFRAAIVGAHGTGKTTLLEELGNRLRERGWSTLHIRCDAEHRTVPRDFKVGLSKRSAGEPIVLFDGAEQLRPPAWWWFRHRLWPTGGLIITTHRAGRLPTLLECHTSADLLAELAGQLLERADEGVRATAKSLFRNHRGNLRDALREWYDRLASTRPPSAPAPGLSTEVGSVDPPRNRALRGGLAIPSRRW